ncbi:MAG: SDR family NAD(P)-dependent oxidoreductase, partial [Candidatus Hydrogenedentes bacterium]|nr:SDR family NAD(P)-dependent oxidoreductase [Candidatus Hydrogenedentota bacterium]
MEIRESTILITGASQGLGRALAIHLAGQGARLLLAARNELGLQETHEQIAGRDSS